MDGFVVLPDSANVSAHFEGATTISHPSGRPWIVGRWAEHEIVQATLGSTRVAVIGYCPVSATRLAELFLRVRTLSDVDSVVRELPGSFHLVVAVGDRVRVQGSISGLRKVFHAAGVASSRSDLLARQIGAPLSDEYLAVRLISLMLPPPLTDMSPWSGVEAVPGGCYLELAARRAPRVVRWWDAPRPDVALADGAAAVREALAAPPVVRGRLSADLSGGMDSTSLCFLAAQSHPNLLTVRWAEADVTNDDAVFAAHAAAELPSGEHLVLRQDEMPAQYAEAGVPIGGEEPFLFPRGAAGARFVLEALAARGSTLHLSGHGGDEVFVAPKAYLHVLLRDRPLVALKHLRVHRSVHSWPLLPTLSALLSGGDLAASWLAAADDLTGAVPGRRTADFGWMRPLRAPAWLSRDAVETVRALFRKTAAETQPLAGDRAQHLVLASIRSTSTFYRVLVRMYRGAGIELRLPFLDDRVIDAALGVRLHERSNPLRYKPLLAESMRGIVPDQILSRGRKAGFSTDIRAGMRRQLTEILELFDNSLLAERGLIDVDVLRAKLLAPQPENHAIYELDPALACESWLRSLKNVS